MRPSLLLTLAGLACGDAEPTPAAPVDTIPSMETDEPPADTEPTPEPVDPPDEGPPDWLATARCGQPAPEGLLHAAPPRPYSGGTCPTLSAGMNTILSGGRERRFLLLMPEDVLPEERLPVLFAWHWLQADPYDYIEEGDMENAARQQRFIAVIPESPEDIDIFGIGEFPWPFLTLTPPARFEEEVTFFDDMHACVSEAFPVEPDCVSLVGVSAGALFGDQLATRRSDVLASAISLSGGIGEPDGLSNQFVMRWHEPEVRDMPFFVLWGGPRDSCVLVNFEQASQALERQLTRNGSFFVECVHNCRHSVPPMEAPPGYTQFAAVWNFFLSHPYWLPEGASPYQVSGLPADDLPWCGIGQGAAVPRTGECGELSCPL